MTNERVIELDRMPLWIWGEAGGKLLGALSPLH
jgi:hypothetical protein